MQNGSTVLIHNVLLSGMLSENHLMHEAATEERENYLSGDYSLIDDVSDMNINGFSFVDSESRGEDTIFEYTYEAKEVGFFGGG